MIIKKVAKTIPKTVFNPDVKYLKGENPTSFEIGTKIKKLDNKKSRNKNHWEDKSPTKNQTINKSKNALDFNCFFSSGE